MQKSDTVTFEKCGESHSLTKRKNLCIFYQTIKVSILQEASLNLEKKKLKIRNKKKYFYLFRNPRIVQLGVITAKKNNVT